MNLPEGLPAWAYIVVSALVLAAQIVTAIWINHRGDERDRATRGEITNNHEMPLRDDLDDKALRTLDAIESLRGAVDGLRDDMNGEFATSIVASPLPSRTSSNCATRSTTSGAEETTTNRKEHQWQTPKAWPTTRPPTPPRFQV